MRSGLSGVYFPQMTLGSAGNCARQQQRIGEKMPNGVDVVMDVVYTNAPHQHSNPYSDWEAFQVNTMNYFPLCLELYTIVGAADV